MAEHKDVKALLLEYLKELHLPAMRASYEELARQAKVQDAFRDLFARSGFSDVAAATHGTSGAGAARGRRGDMR